MINLGYPDIGSLRGPVRTKTRKQENEASIRKIKIKIKTHLLICKLMSKDKNMKIISNITTNRKSTLLTLLPAFHLYSWE